MFYNYRNIILYVAKILMDLRKLVVWKANEGWSQRLIATDLNISRCAVQNILKKSKEHNSIENRPKIGRPRIHSARSMRLMIRNAKANPKKTAPELLQDWRSSLPTSVNTVKRILRKYNLFRHIAAKKPLLNERFVRTRLQWCTSYTKVDPSFWENVIFSDESRLELFSRKWEYVCRPPVVRHDAKYTTKLSNTVVTVWWFGEP